MMMTTTDTTATVNPTPDTARQSEIDIYKISRDTMLIMLPDLIRVDNVPDGTTGKTKAVITVTTPEEAAQLLTVRLAVDGHSFRALPGSGSGSALVWILVNGFDGLHRTPVQVLNNLRDLGAEATVVRWRSSVHDDAVVLAFNRFGEEVDEYGNPVTRPKH
jgi:hypothetical protein